MMKSGFIGIIGRPNVGKIDTAQQYTGRKIAITGLMLLPHYKKQYQEGFYTLVIRI